MDPGGTNMNRTALTVATLLGSTSLALAQTPPPDPSTMVPPTTGVPATTEDQPPADPPKAEKKEPGRGDFDAGGQVRLPSGPDDMGEYKTFNWVALDLKGKYYVFDTVTINGNIPVALIKPEMVGGIEPKMFG